MYPSAGEESQVGDFLRALFRHPGHTLQSAPVASPFSWFSIILNFVFGRLLA